MDQLAPGSVQRTEEPLLTPEDEERLANKLTYTLWGLSGLVVLGAIAVSIQQTWEQRAAAELWALACLAIGVVVGFLFAVPRAPRVSNQVAQAWQEKSAGMAQATGSDPRLGINTNLEEISDWLTKIMVGLGLVELRTLPGHLSQVGQYMGQCLGAHGGACASATLLYFSALGFVGGYLMTRMFFGPAFHLADRATRAGIDDTRALAEKAFAKATGNQVEAKVDSAVETASDELRQEPLRKGRIEQLIRQLAGYVKQYPIKRKLNFVLARLYWEGLEQLDNAKATINRFIEAKEQAQQKDTDLADAFFNLACYESLAMKNCGGAEKQGYAEKALTALVRSFEISPQGAADVETDSDLEELRKSEYKTQVDELVGKYTNQREPSVTPSTNLPPQA